MAADLEAIAAQLAAPGKGLLASDESISTVGKRLEKAGIPNTAESRRDYRELFYTADGLGDSISGAILFKEQLFQSASDGMPFVECLARQHVLAGVKVDEGLVPLEGRAGETVTRGIDTLHDSCVWYYAQGARFAKWRAALRVADGCPSEEAVTKNAEQLAQYAAICQACGLVPIVEPEVLIDGAHDVHKFADVNERVISACVAACWKQGVLLEGSLIKPQMMIAGSECTGPKPDSKTIAELTLRVMRRCVPAAVPGIMFLSGGQSEDESTVNLQAINALAQQQGHAPWSLSFSFGRALQASVLKIWSADRSKTHEARQMAVALAKANAAAVCGNFAGRHPSLTSADESLVETYRGWRTDVK